MNFFKKLFKKDKVCCEDIGPKHPRCRCSKELVEILPEVISLDAAALKDVLSVRCRRKQGETAETYSRRLENKVVEIKEALRKAVIV